MSARLYRDFTSIEALNAEYNIEATVPDLGVYVDQFIRQSAEARQALTGHLDVRYGPTLAETYDVFMPPNADPKARRPTLFFIHGGYWKVTTSKEWSYIARGLCERGWTVVIENYALCPKVSLAEIVRQHRAALAHLWQHADAWGVDRSRLVVAGHSAGGHGAATLLGADWTGDYGLPSPPFAGVLGVCGLYDLRPLPHCFVGPELGLDMGAAVALSPLLELPRQAPRCIWAHGTQETNEFARQTIDYAAAWQAAGLPGERLVLARNHFNILDRLADGEGELAQAVQSLADTAAPRLTA